MASKAMNDKEVMDEMNKMVSFIQQEANEKAREIKVKADEEFNIEKAKIVRQETISIESFYQKKAKQAEIQKKIAESNLNNKTRLQILQTRQQYLNELNEEIRKLLIKVSEEDKEKYQTTIKNLILQSLYQLMEEDIIVNFRQKDEQVVKAAAAEALEIYKAKVNKECKIVFGTDYLSPESAGGIVMSGFGDRIKIDNTLENRLEIASDELLPVIKTILFGNSASRKFFD